MRRWMDCLRENLRLSMIVLPFSLWHNVSWRWERAEALSPDSSMAVLLAWPPTPKATFSQVPKWQSLRPARENDNRNCPSPGDGQIQVPWRICMMRTLTLLGLVVLLLPLLAACGTTVDSAKADFCDDLAAFGQSLTGLRDLHAGSTKEDFQDAFGAAEKAWEDLKDSGSKLEDVQLDAVEDAFGDLKNAVQDIPDDATLTEALASVKDAAVTMLSEIVRITATTCTFPQE